MKYSSVLIMAISLLVATSALAQHKVVLQLENATMVSSGAVNNDQRVLLPVDLPKELTNVVIDYAKLTLTVDSTSFTANARTLGVALFPLTAQWSMSTPWSSSWESPNGVYDQNVGQFGMTSKVKNGVIEFQIAEIVQAWVDGTLNNFGLLLRSSLEGTRDLSLAGSTGNVQLTIYYTKRE